ncbi:TetR/AcrR family transcriptional regulator [Rhodococcus sp. KBS0724]|uniref:TetR/AcrR family transcriptional regulator n=1 Tax=Rhodococcus sp. KBS0724 TaxID=1179674 RepID=UPI00163DD6D3|nr:TetR/AcrR family transcriptional regulator [Rhodococcus sp. KBS0724]
MPDNTARGGRRHAGLRADARRSIERIVTAAESLISSRGPEVTLEEVAREAGVAPATLYRHFPSRMHLFEDMYRGKTAAFAERATDLASNLSPLDALVQWLREFIDLCIESDSFLSSLLGQGLRETDPEENLRWGYSKIVMAAEGLLVEAQRTKALRPSINASELIVLVSGVARAIELASPSSRIAPSGAMRDRFLMIILEGILEPSEAVSLAHPPHPS